MSTQYFQWSGVVVTTPGDTYTDGNPIEFQFSGMPRLAIQGWHNIAPVKRTAIINRLRAAGWIEGEQSKPD